MSAHIDVDAATRPPPRPRAGRPARLRDAYRSVRATTERLAAPLSPEDCQVQSMPDASPVKWHLAHTTWFFETFVLAPHRPDHRPFDPSFCYLFNSYYNAVGDRLPRPRRGLVTRPGLDDVLAYRAAVDAAMGDFLSLDGLGAEVLDIVELGLNHEQQHQELILTDVKHALAQNPLRPAYREAASRTTRGQARPLGWSEIAGGIVEIGHDGRGFAFDNEGPRHRVYLHDFRIADRLATVGEYLAFVDDGGYERPEFWLSDGWGTVNGQGWRAPLYWERVDGSWWVTTLDGFRRLDESEPSCHVSFYEADAFARWAGARLPTEVEWEVAAADRPIEGTLLESDALHPHPAPSGSGLVQFFGDAWEWMRSPYTPYPGSKPVEGALGEYNAKFMCNQMVLRGGSCATPASHIRASYRNFFPPEARWQFTGIRLAKDPS